MARQCIFPALRSKSQSENIPAEGGLGRAYRSDFTPSPAWRRRFSLEEEAAKIRITGRDIAAGTRHHGKRQVSPR
ncbi:hypothetical protein [Erwinia tasmaniensis]|uniref:hypothetical protein n=1 Tax=Erwinia tasmaniensis TaxID=338565 RepID=UPI0012FEF858|nr:hypothetical protein [Erwinia tasmaniensis]